MEVRHEVHHLFLLAAWTFCKSQGVPGKWKLYAYIYHYHVCQLSTVCLNEMSQLRL